MPFDDQSAVNYGQIRAQLAASGTPLDPNDLLIASIALANNLILVTHNTRDFSRVEGLRLEDWEIEAGVELLENDGVIALENMQLRSS